MSDKEILFQAFNKYAKDLASNLFHLNSVASQAVITYVVKNMEDKYPDGYVTNIFGKPVKFNDEDITQLLNLFKQNK
jgi:hypothetical protein